MRKLILPERKDNTVEIAELNEEHHGLLLVKSNNDCIGFIIYFDYNGWSFVQNINVDIQKSSDSLFELVKELQDDYSELSIELIDFV